MKTYQRNDNKIRGYLFTLHHASYQQTIQIMLFTYNINIKYLHRFLNLFYMLIDCFLCSLYNRKENVKGAAVLYQNCQLFTSSSQKECQSSTLQVARLDSSVVSICYNNSKSIIINNTFYAITSSNIYQIRVPVDGCQQTFAQYALTQQISNYAVALGDNNYLYIYGQTYDKTYQLYQIDLIQLNSNSFNQTLLPNQSLYLVTLSQTIYDGTLDTVTYYQQFPQLNYLINKNVSFTLNYTNKNTTDCAIVPCLDNTQLIYYDKCVYAFFGSYSSAFQQSIWKYYLDYSVWQQFSIKNIPSFSQTPPIAQLVNINKNIFALVDQQYLYVLDILEQEWYQVYKNTQIPSYVSQLIAYNNELYFLGNQNLIWLSLNYQNADYYIYGMQQCKDGYKGVYCDQKICNGACFSFLYQPDICIECYDHGQCVNGQCQCDSDYNLTDFCTKQTTCLNNCTSNGVCQQYFPYSLCQCNQVQYRGGNDCSNIFCLNDCSNNGECDSSGKCKCSSQFGGEDCSILQLSFINGS
ncbi:hypothetical protein pb186bvf_003447 [Paramecium bursaria]